MLRLGASATLGLIDGINGVVAERTENNKSYINAATPVLTHQFVQFIPNEFAASTVQSQRESFYYRFSAEEIEMIERNTNICTTHTAVNPLLRAPLTSTTTELNTVWRGPVSGTLIWCYKRLQDVWRPVLVHP